MPLPGPHRRPFAGDGDGCVAVKDDDGPRWVDDDGDWTTWDDDVWHLIRRSKSMTLITGMGMIGGGGGG